MSIAWENVFSLDFSRFVFRVMDLIWKVNQCGSFRDYGY